MLLSSGLQHSFVLQKPYYVSARMSRCKDADLSWPAITNCTHACYADDYMVQILARIEAIQAEFPWFVQLYAGIVW